MELGKRYRIWYKDDQNVVRDRKILVIRVNNFLVEYKNLYNNNIEGVSLGMICRYEQLNTEEGTKYEKSKTEC